MKLRNNIRFKLNFLGNFNLEQEEHTNKFINNKISEIESLNNQMKTTSESYDGVLKNKQYRYNNNNAILNLKKMNFFQENSYQNNIYDKLNKIENIKKMIILQNMQKNMTETSMNAKNNTKNDIKTETNENSNKSENTESKTDNITITENVINQNATIISQNNDEDEDHRILNDDDDDMNTVKLIVDKWDSDDETIANDDATINDDITVND